MLFPPRYIIRTLKSILYIAMFFFLIFFLIFTFAEPEPTREGLTFIDFVAVNKWPQLIAFIVLFGCTYPLIAFYRKEIWLVKPFAEEKAAIVGMFLTSGYELASDNGSVLEFQLKNKFHRLMRLFMEDSITLDYSQGNPIVIAGLRKDAYRLGRHVEYLNKQAEEE